MQVADARKALAISAANYYTERPKEVLKLIGVTGTNGKTTTSFWWIRSLRAAGSEVGLLGTIDYRLVRRISPCAKHDARIGTIFRRAWPESFAREARTRCSKRARMRWRWTALMMPIRRGDTQILRVSILRLP